MQPFGVIPVYEELNENDEREFKIYESRAICRYFNLISGGNLVPKEPRAYGLFEQFATTELETTDPILMKIVFQRVFSKFHGKEADEAIVQAQIEPLRVSLGVLNKQLKSTQNYIVGDFTLVDIFYTPLFQHLYRTPEWKVVEDYPAVVAWFHRVTSRPAWKKVLETTSF
jgi:glutathione S-transferase